MEVHGLPEWPEMVERGSRRVCIVVDEIGRRDFCDSVAGMYTSLAETLAGAGHDVTMLFAAREYDRHGLGDWIARCGEKGFGGTVLPPRPFPIGSPSTPHLAIAYEVYLWLKQRAFDVVHFPLRNGPGYWTILAKHEGLAFRDKLFCVGAIEPTVWRQLADRGRLNSVEQLAVDFMERRCAELADLLWSPTQYMIYWLRGEGWALPERTVVQPAVFPEAGASGKASPVNEIVFFGTLEPWKGVPLLCDALDRIAQSETPEFSVTFLGTERLVAQQNSTDYIKTRGVEWPFRFQVLSNRGIEHALDYLKRDGVAVVLPSMADNLPFTLQNCLANGVPFLASDVEGLAEAVAEEDRERVLVPPRPAEWAGRIERALREGIEPARPASEPEETRTAWLDWHAGLPQARETAPVAIMPPAEEDAPLVSVCIPTWNRPALLRRALDSIRRQDYPNFEVIVVDDASDDPDAVAYLDELEEEFAACDWRVIRQPRNMYPAAARNVAANRASGEYLFFMDDDDIAEPDAVSVLMYVIQRTGADIATSCSRYRIVHSESSPDCCDATHALFMGGAAGPGLFWNVMGPMTSLIRTDVWTELGGMTEDYGVGNEDWEFFARAVLAGYAVEVVPEPCFSYFRSAVGVHLSTPLPKNLLRVTRPYRQALAPQLSGLALLGADALEPPEAELKPPDYRALPGLHLIRVGLSNCLREGLGPIIKDIRRKIDEWRTKSGGQSGPRPR